MKTPLKTAAYVLLGYGLYLLLSGKKTDKKKTKTGLTNFINPVPGSIVTSIWGDDRKYINSKHYGMDFRAAKGVPVLASIGGVVIEKRNDNETTAGKHVIIKTELPGGMIINVRYLHLDSIGVHLGQKVEQGAIIGTVGDTYGPVAGGAAPHLHYDMAGNRAVIDSYKNAYGVPSGGFPEARSFGIQFPSEPFVPATYQGTALARVQSRNVPTLA